MVASVTKSARTLHAAADVAPVVDEAFSAARSPHRGPTFVDVPMDVFFESATVAAPAYTAATAGVEADPDAVGAIGALLAGAARPVLVFGSDVWTDGAEEAALRLVEDAGPARDHQRHGPRRRPGRPPDAGDQGARPRPGRRATCRSWSAHPWTSGSSYGVFGGKDGAPPAKVVHIADSPDQVSGHADLAGSASGDLTLVLDGVRSPPCEQQPRRPDWSAWVERAPGHRRRGRRARRRPADRRRPTRSTRPASTASCSRAWPTTRW